MYFKRNLSLNWINEFQISIYVDNIHNDQMVWWKILDFFLVSLCNQIILSLIRSFIHSLDQFSKNQATKSLIIIHCQELLMYSSPVTLEIISMLLKNVLAVLPSLVLPVPCFGASTIIPNSFRNCSCILFFSSAIRDLSTALDTWKIKWHKNNFNLNLKHYLIRVLLASFKTYPPFFKRKPVGYVKYQFHKTDVCM